MAETNGLLNRRTLTGYRGFESPLLRKNEVVAQLDRASDCGSEGRRFESSQPQRELYWSGVRVAEGDGFENR